jgi:uncharacterized protein YndB with AHSA1/START domain
MRNPGPRRRGRRPRPTESGSIGLQKGLVAERATVDGHRPGRPRVNRLDVVRLEVERGGHWRFVEHHDGAADGFEGRFREVTPPERIVQTFEWDGMPGHVIVNATTLEEVAPGRTRVTVVSLFHTPEERDGMLQSGMEAGLNRSYDVLDAVLTSIG